jgi:hypothetical protein
MPHRIDSCIINRDEGKLGSIFGPPVNPVETEIVIFRNLPFEFAVSLFVIG